MQKKMIIFFSILFLFATAFSTASAQKRRMPEPKIGLSSTFSSTPTISVPVWVTQKVSIVPMISFTKTDQVSSTVTPGAAVHVHTKKGRIQPYFGAQFMASIYSPNSGTGWTTLFVGGLFGADYFLHPMFSIGIESQLNTRLENKDAAMPMQISTTTVVKATVYIK